LDYGCASGEYSLVIGNLVDNVIGIDISEEMIKLANQKMVNRKSNNIEFHQSDITDKRFKPNTFSTILAFNIFHLLKDIPNSFSRLNLLLENEGIIISQTPCLGNRNIGFRTFLKFAKKIGIYFY